MYNRSIYVPIIVCMMEAIQWTLSIHGLGHKIWSWKNVHIIFVSVCIGYGFPDRAL